MRETGIFTKCFSSDFPPAVTVEEMGGYSNHYNSLQVKLIFHNKLEGLEIKRAQEIEEETKRVTGRPVDIPTGAKETLVSAILGSKRIYREFVYYDVASKLPYTNYENLLDSLRNIEASKIIPSIYGRHTERSRANINQLTEPFLP